MGFDTPVVYAVNDEYYLLGSLLESYGTANALNIPPG